MYLTDYVDNQGNIRPANASRVAIKQYEAMVKGVQPQQLFIDDEQVYR